MALSINYRLALLTKLGIKQIMALSINDRLALLTKLGIKQIHIARCVGDKNISTVNNVLHERNKTGKKTKKIQSVIAALFDMPYEHVWSTDD